MQPKKSITSSSAWPSFAGGLALSVAACKKYLITCRLPKAPLTAAFVFSDVPNATKAVLASYQDLEGDNGYGIRISMYFAYDNDEMIGMHQLGDNDRGDIAHYNANSGNAQLYNPWVQLYQGIERANICIYNIPQMPLYTTGSALQVAELHRLLGEALTLRAQFYLEIVRNWGDVPAQWLPSAQETNLFLAKTDRDTIYNHLLNDLQQAEGLVPWRTQLASVTGDPADERITLGAVKALRARIALYRGGYSLRRASSIYGQTMARPADYLDYYKIALQECSDIMARPGDHTLNPSFQAVFKNGPDAHTIDATYGEIMFEVGMSGGQGTNDSKLGYYDGTKVNASLTGNAAIGVLPTVLVSVRFHRHKPGCDLCGIRGQLRSQYAERTPDHDASRGEVPPRLDHQSFCYDIDGAILRGRLAVHPLLRRAAHVCRSRQRDQQRRIRR